MLGAIAGDVIGSLHEFMSTKRTDFELFEDHSTYTDDTVLTVAIADSLLSGASYVDTLRDYTKAYPNRCYGGRFWEWVQSGSREPYNSWGNGAAMRVSPVAYARETLDDVLVEARRSAEVTHNHPEGVRGAQATAAATFLAHHGESKSEIRKFIETKFGYDLKRTIDEIRPTYTFNESCQGTVPEAIIAFLDSTDYEHSVRLAVSLGGDADTLACITGGISEAFYGGVPRKIARATLTRLDEGLKDVLMRFRAKYCGDPDRSANHEE